MSLRLREPSYIQEGAALPDRCAAPRSRAAEPLRDLRAVVLLGGSVRATALRANIGRSVLDLPVESASSVLDCWRQHCIGLAVSLELRAMPVRLVLDQAAPEPHHGWPSDEHALLCVERDPMEYRGTGGVLRDLAAAYRDDDYLLVANAAQLLTAPLASLAKALAAPRSDVSVISHYDGTPSGLMLVRAGCLAHIPRHGFVDMKEQALPAIARRHEVRVVERQRPTGLPIRTLSNYIDALSQHHRELAGLHDLDPLHLEQWRPLFSLVEQPSEVHPRARVHNSVVLRGGRVQDGAVVVGSVVCPGGIVWRRRMAADEVVCPARPRRK